MSYKPKIKIDKNYLIKEYTIKNRSALNISEELNCSQITIVRRLREYGIRVKTIGEIQKGKKKWEKKPHPKGMLNKKHSEYTREKMKNSAPRRKGKLANNWKGGLTPLYLLIRRSSKVEKWREEIYKRDNYTCQKCFKRNGNGKYVKLNAHHIIHFKKLINKFNIKTIDDAFKNNKLWNLDNGITLCLECHKKIKHFGRPKK